MTKPKVKKKKSDILAWNNTFGDKIVSSRNNVFSEKTLGDEMVSSPKVKKKKKTVWPFGRGVNVWPNPQTRHEPDTGFFGFGLDLNGFGS